MAKGILWDEAIANVSDYMDRMKGYSAFDGSTALAIVFGCSKEQALDSIIKYRTNH